MNLIYSAINPKPPVKNSGCTELEQRYRAYNEACLKHQNTINYIRRYFPGWTPRFR